MHKRYEDHDFDVSVVIDGLQNEMLEKMEAQEQSWIDRFMTILPESLDQSELDKWKRNTQPLPVYVSATTTENYRSLLARVEEELSKQRVNYIAFLFKQLSADEKKIALEKIMGQEESI